MFLLESYCHLRYKQYIILDVYNILLQCKKQLSIQRNQIHIKVYFLKIQQDYIVCFSMKLIRSRMTTFLRFHKIIRSNKTPIEEAMPTKAMKIDKTVILLYCPDYFAFHLGMAFTETLRKRYDHNKCWVIAPIPFKLSNTQNAFRSYVTSNTSLFITVKELDIIIERKTKISEIETLEQRIESLNRIFATQRFLNSVHHYYNKRYCNFKSSINHIDNLSRHNIMIKNTIKKNEKDNQITIVIVNDESTILKNNYLKATLRNNMSQPNANIDVIPVAFMTNAEKTAEKIKKYNYANVNIFDIDTRNELITPKSLGTKLFNFIESKKKEITEERIKQMQDALLPSAQPVATESTDNQVESISSINALLPTFVELAEESDSESTLNDSIQSDNDTSTNNPIDLNTSAQPVATEYEDNQEASTSSGNDETLPSEELPINMAFENLVNETLSNWQQSDNDDTNRQTCEDSNTTSRITFDDLTSMQQRKLGNVFLKYMENFNIQYYTRIKNIKPEAKNAIATNAMKSGKTVILLSCPDDFAFHLGMAFIETIITHYRYTKSCAILPILLHSPHFRHSFNKYLKLPQSHFIKEKEWDILDESMESLNVQLFPNTESLNKMYATERFLKLFNYHNKNFKKKPSNDKHNCEFVFSGHEHLKHKIPYAHSATINQKCKIILTSINEEGNKIAVALVENESLMLDDDKNVNLQKNIKS